jgi:phage terminase Nu1 subunit (DNA packaging protein)
MPRSTASDDLPDYNESRARTEFERANLLELERRQKEGLLIERKVVETTWATIITTSKTKILGIPSRIRQRIPHLTLEEVQLITELVEETLEELSQEAEGET